MPSTPPVASASLNKSNYAPGELMVLTIDHTDVDRATITIAGNVTDSTGASGPWSATATIDDGVVTMTETAGKVWTVASATPSRTVFTATA